MKRSSFLIYLAISAIFIQSCGNQNEQQSVTEEIPRIIPVREFFKNPDKSSYRISPSGEYVSYMTSYESRMNIFVQKVGTEEVQRVTEVTDRDIAGNIQADSEREHDFRSGIRSCERIQPCRDYRQRLYRAFSG